MSHIWGRHARASLLSVAVLAVLAFFAPAALAGGLTVAPPSANLAPMATQMFTASGGSGSNYQWSLKTNNSGGNISAAGLYTAGSTANVMDVVQVTNTVTTPIDAGADASPDAAHSTMMMLTATANVTIGMGVVVSPSMAMVATMGMQTFTVSGGSPPYTWAVTTNGSGGASITSPGGVYTAGSMVGMDVVTATDSQNNTGTASITVTASMTTLGGVGAYCDGGGGGCMTGTQCVDQVCCTSACTGTCQACNTPSSPGMCVTITGTAILPRTCPMSDKNNVCSQKMCDGTNPTTCTVLAASETQCGAASCDNGIGTPGAVCTGDGGCQPVKPASCGAYACVSDQCATSCFDSSECAAHYYCDLVDAGGEGGAGKCVPGAPVPDAGNNSPDAGSSSNPSSSGGCTLGQTGQGAGALFGSLSVMGLAFLARRRRR